MYDKHGNHVSKLRIRAIIERNDLGELKKLFRDHCIGDISQHTREWYFNNYLNLVDIRIGDRGVKPAQMWSWSLCSQIIDSILTHPEYRCRVRAKRDITLSVEELN